MAASLKDTIRANRFDVFRHTLRSIALASAAASGLALGGPAGAAVGSAVALSEVLGGHLTPEQLVPLVCELVTYGVAAGWLSRFGRDLGSMLLCLVGAQLLGRVAYLVPALALGKPLLRSLRGLFLAPWPGLLLQLTLLPIVALWLARRARPAQVPASQSIAKLRIATPE